jgi:DICT domain-containing protein
MGPGMAPEPAPGVRGANIDANDELFDEWGIAVIAPHFAAAFVARPAADKPRNVPDVERQYDFALTYNREYVVETARNMMSKITPHTGGAALGAAGV